MSNDNKGVKFFVVIDEAVLTKMCSSLVAAKRYADQEYEEYQERHDVRIFATNGDVYELFQDVRWDKVK